MSSRRKRKAVTILYSLVSNQHRPLTPFDERDECAWFCDLRRLVDQDRVELGLAQRSQSSTRTRREHDASSVDALLCLSMQTVVFVVIAAHPGVDCIALER